MLSNTEERKPRPSAVCHDAAGSFSTGIIEAHSTSESRKIEPLQRAGQQLPVGRTQRRGHQDRQATAAPRNGK